MENILVKIAKPITVKLALQQTLNNVKYAFKVLHLMIKQKHVNRLLVAQDLNFMMVNNVFVSLDILDKIVHLVLIDVLAVKWMGAHNVMQDIFLMEMENVVLVLLIVCNVFRILNV